MSTAPDGRTRPPVGHVQRSQAQDHPSDVLSPFEDPVGEGRLLQREGPVDERPEPAIEVQIRSTTSPPRTRSRTSTTRSASSSPGSARGSEPIGADRLALQR
jgi:hypothetical protein